jgi:hypothetical protein
MPLGEPTDKFECRYCGCKQSKVTGTEVIEREFRKKKITTIKRRRQCRNCGITFTTVEFQHEDLVKSPSIPHDSAMRPAYDLGRAAGNLEIINGLLSPAEAQANGNPYPPLPAAKEPSSRPFPTEKPPKRQSKHLRRKK